VSTSADSGFRPDRHGFGFPNRYTNTLVYVPVPLRRLLPEPLRASVRNGRVVADGRCGGMSFAAIDYYRSGSPVPRFLFEQLPPPDAHPLSRFIGKRQRDSVSLRSASRFVSRTLERRDNRSGDFAQLIEGVAALLERDEPVVLGLVRASRLSKVFENHQVVGFAVERSPVPTVLVYDSRFVGKTHRLVEDEESGIVQLDEDDGLVDGWRVVFVQRYAPVSPPVWDEELLSHPPPSPTDLAAVVDGRTAVLTWRTNATQTAGCEIRVRAAGSLWRRSALLRQAGGPDFEYVLKRPENQDAAVHIRAVNQAGWSDPTETISIGPPVEDSRAAGS
jgi:hypothetical protein